MATVQEHAPSVKEVFAEREHVPGMFSSQLSAVELHALKVFGKREADSVRDQLAPGRYLVDFTARVRGLVTVGEDTTSASSVTPEPAQLIACILGKLNEATRNSILKSLPELYVEHGNQMPPCDQAILGDVTVMLAKLRATNRITKRGAVSGEFIATALDREIVSESKPLTVVG